MAGRTIVVRGTFSKSLLDSTRAELGVPAPSSDAGGKIAESLPFLSWSTDDAGSAIWTREARCDFEAGAVEVAAEIAVLNAVEAVVIDASMSRTMGN